jgi:hypothetical protein
LLRGPFEAKVNKEIIYTDSIALDILVLGSSMIFNRSTYQRKKELQEFESRRKKNTK